MILYIVIIVVQFVTIIILGLVVMRMRRSQGSKNSKMEVVDERHNAGFDGTASSEKDVSVENANAEEYSNYEELHRQEDKHEHTYQSLLNISISVFVFWPPFICSGVKALISYYY